MPSAIHTIAPARRIAQVLATTAAREDFGARACLSAALALLKAPSSVSGRIDPIALWRLLTGGQLRVCQVSYVGGRCFGSLAKGEGGALSPSDVTLLERALRGEPLKALAIDLRVAPSTLSVRCKDLLRIIGPGTSIHRVPIFLVMACQATGKRTVPHARFEGYSEAGQLVISTDVLTRELRSSLSDAEWEVTRLSVEGRSTGELSNCRGTSHRTTANQLAAIFQKLGVGNRRELRAKAAVYQSPV